MRLLHLADLHLGKCVLEAPMLENQRRFLGDAVRIAAENAVDAVMIAGDIYDRSVPPADAVEALDDFLSALNKAGIPVLAVSGNHDSPERLDFGSRLFADSGVHIAGRYDGHVRCVTLNDSFGPIRFYLLPFLKPVMVRAALGEEAATTDEAVRLALRGLPDDLGCRSVLIAHQFVCAGGEAPETCDSETISVGGSDSVDVSCFDGFDYVALGHLHRPQRMGRDTVRYAGSPLKYSLSEVRFPKSLPLVTLAEKGQVTVERIPINPLHDMRRIRGRLEDLLTAGREDPADAEDYIHAVLTEAVLDPAERLRTVYPNLLHVEIESPEHQETEDAVSDPLAHKSEQELFEDFYRQVNGEPLSDEQRTVLDLVVAKVKGEDAG